MLGDIARDLGETEQLSMLVPQGRDDRVREELCPAFANAPALFFIPAFRRGGAQRLFRPALRRVFASVEPPEVLREDFFGPVADHPLGAGVPTADQPVGVHHENRVVLYSLDEHVEAPLAFFQGRFRLAPFSLLLSFAHGALDGRDELGEAVFEHIIGGAALEGFYGQFLAQRAGHEDERHVGALVFGDGQRGEAVEARQAVIGEDDIGTVMGELVKKVVSGIHAFGSER